MKKMVVLFIIVAIICAIMVPVFLTGCNNFKIDTERVDMQIEGALKVGVISDTQLPAKENRDNGKYKNHLIKALELFKEKGVNLILFAGDIGDSSTNYAYNLANSAFDEVYGDNKPYVQFIMGNHDYWDGGSANACRKRFAKNFKQSPWSVYTYGGITFIGVSPDSGSMSRAYSKIEEWLKTEIETAKANNPGKPIFVMTHATIENTVYGSDDWGDKTLGYLQNYEEVVSLSGHSHYSLLDENSIYQDGFTAINTQSLAYIELEKGKENGTIPPDAAEAPMGFIMEFENTDESGKINGQVIIKRYDILTGAEQKANMRWALPIPLTKDTFTYTKDRIDDAPVMISTIGSVTKESGITYLNFTAGTDDDFVHHYKVVYEDGNEQLYFSDFYLGMAKMEQYVKIPVYNKKAGIYNVKVYAVDQYNQVSSNYTEIVKVEVDAKVEYNK